MAPNPPLRWLLLEGDPDLGQAVHDHLRGAGHRVDWCHNRAEAQAAAPPALALLDLRPPATKRRLLAPRPRQQVPRPGASTWAATTPMPAPRSRTCARPPR